MIAKLKHVRRSIGDLLHGLLTLGCALIILLGGSSSTGAQTISVSSDRDAFKTGPIFEGFDKIPAGTRAPFDTGLVRITGGSEVMDVLVGLREPFWFPGYESEPNFLLVNLAFTAEFPKPVQCMSFDLRCFACADSFLNYQLFDISNQLIAAGSLFYDWSSMVYPRFFGVSSTRPLASIHIFGLSAAPGVQGGGNFVIDNLRYAESDAGEACGVVPSTNTFRSNARKPRLDADEKR